MSGTFADAVRIILAQESFDDLDAALALVGAHLRTEHDDSTRLSVAAPPRASEVGMLVRYDATGDEEGGYTTDLIGVLEGEVSGDHTTEVAGPDGEPEPGARASSPRAGGTVPRTGMAVPRDPRESQGRLVICSIISPQRRPPIPLMPVYSPVPPPSSSVTHDVGFSPVVDEQTLGADLYSLVKVPRPGRDIDLAKVVALLARAEAVFDVPLAPTRAAPLSVTVLVEHALRLGPLGHDVEVLLAGLRATLGVERVMVWGFDVRRDIVCGVGPVWNWSADAWHGLSGAVLVVSGPVDRDGPARSLDRVVADREASGAPTRHVVFGEAAPRDQFTWSIDD